MMGIVNLTDNSYFAPSRCLGLDGAADVEEVLRRVERMLGEGADIIDVGACSTRPGSQPVGAEEEWRRLEPVLSALWRRFPNLVVSVDTYWASVIERCYSLAVKVFSVGVGQGLGDESQGQIDEGCVGNVNDRIANQLIVNDISAGEDDPQMLPLAGRLGLAYVAMHKRGTPATMQELCDYEDVVEDVLEYFRAFALRAEKAGVRDWILDPGFGFAKTVEQNYELLRGLRRFSEFGRPILVGVSRKSMITRLHGITTEEALPQTQVLHYAALEAGATILRVHDVAEAARTVRTWLMLR
ncbi:MAG: dihydropteroate synthase family protein [Bacteroidales bacterium]|nr:dihydropteroate synthase family protein [Bacteroidales bacterium]